MTAPPIEASGVAEASGTTAAETTQPAAGPSRSAGQPEQAEADRTAMLRENLALRHRVQELETLLRRARRRSDTMREVNTLLTSLIESTDDFVLIANARGEALFFNSAYARVIEELTGEPPRPGERTHDRLENPKQRAFWDRLHERVLSGEKFRIQHSFEMPGGETRTFELSYNPIWSDGQVIGFSEFTHDLTEHLAAAEERRVLGEQLLQSQKMEALGKLAGGMAHDFNNLLAVVLGNAELILEVATEERIQRRADQIVRIARRARDLTTKLLAFSRRESLETQRVSLAALLKDTLEIVRGSVRRDIVVSEAVRAPETVMDLSLGQVSVALLNACINAADAMPDGGVLELGGDRVTLAEGHPTLPEGQPPGEYCHIWVADTGSGMDEEVRRRATEPFFTTKADGRGTGLGLSVSLGVVEAHGGFLRIQSAPGRGTRVSFYFPVGRSLLARPATLSPACLPAPESLRILIVDDEADFRAVLSEQLESLGHTVVFAASGGTEALLWLRAHRDSVDLVLLDLVMPGLSGRDTYREIQRVAPELPVLLCSGYSQQGDAAALLSAGAVGHLQKPFGLSELARSIRKALGSSARS